MVDTRAVFHVPMFWLKAGRTVEHFAVKAPTLRLAGQVSVALARHEAAVNLKQIPGPGRFLIGGPRRTSGPATGSLRFCLSATVAPAGGARAPHAPVEEQDTHWQLGVLPELALRVRLRPPRQGRSGPGRACQWLLHSHHGAQVSAKRA